MPAKSPLQEERENYFEAFIAEAPDGSSPLKNLLAQSRPAQKIWNIFALHAREVSVCARAVFLWWWLDAEASAAKAALEAAAAVEDGGRESAGLKERLTNVRSWAERERAELTRPFNEARQDFLERIRPVLDVVEGGQKAADADLRRRAEAQRVADSAARDKRLADLHKAAEAARAPAAPPEGAEPGLLGHNAPPPSPAASQEARVQAESAYRSAVLDASREAAAPAPRIQTPTGGKVSEVKGQLTYKVEDITAVPPEYLAVDPGKVRAEINRQLAEGKKDEEITISGLRIFRGESKFVARGSRATQPKEG